MSYVKPGQFRIRKARLAQSLSATRMKEAAITAAIDMCQKATHAALADAMAKPFDPIDCAEQFSRECI